MAFLINSAYTLPEILRTKAPDGSHMAAIDVLSGQYPIIEEGYWEQANGDTTHEFVQMVSEPTGTLVRYNEGTALSVATTKNVTEFMARLEDRMQIDVRILEKAPNPVRYRMEREAAHARGLIKTYHSIVFSKDGYGSRGTDLKDINGLGIRYGVLAADTVVSNGSASGSTNGSIWIIKHGPNDFFNIYPKNMQKILKQTDLKIQPAYDASGNRYEVVMTKFEWEFGIGIGDPRSVKRLCNITTSGNNSFWQDGTNVAKGEENLIDLIEALPNGDLSNTAIYCGPKMMAQFRKRMNAKTNMYFTMETIWNRPQLAFMGIPIVRVDTLDFDESVIA
jgi:hypothetical protein